MKSLIHKRRIAFIFLFSLSFANVSLAYETKSSESIVHDFYSAYLQDKLGGNKTLI